MPAEAKKPILSARELALRVLDAALVDREPPEARFAREVAKAGLSARDRAFARLLYTTVLRQKAAIDKALMAHLREPPKKRQAMNLLRLGAAQLLYLRTAPHAGVGECVELAKRRRLAPPGLVNAVLRKLVGAEPPAMTPLETLPGWLAARWTRTYGLELATAMAAAVGTAPPLDLSVKEAPLAWAERLGGRVVGPEVGGPATVRLADAGLVEDLPGYAEGAWWVQDLAASLPVRVLRPTSGERVLDLCAAPGGKTAQLLMAGAVVTSVERDAARAERLRANLRRLGLDALPGAAVVVADLLDYAPAEPFDAVLLDAPCTATGTIRRHPDIMWSKGPSDVVTLSALQQLLLAKATGFVRPGGRLVYAVCSMEPEEGPEVVERFLAAHPAFARAPIAPAETGIPPTTEGDLRTHPAMLADQGGMDGFYIARLVHRPRG
jgi:16S rRNA (cytosine967-C5)-methyltransferase